MYVLLQEQQRQKGLKGAQCGRHIPPGRAAERSCEESREASLQHQLFYSWPQELEQLSLGTRGLSSWSCLHPSYF